MPLTEEQQGRLGVELAALVPALKRAAPPERAKLVREALERAGAQPTWAEWDECAAALLGDDAALICSDALQR
jgi:hypothetical protein